MKHALKKRYSLNRRLAKKCGSWLAAGWETSNNYRFFKKRKGRHKINN